MGLAIHLGLDYERNAALFVLAITLVFIIGFL